MEDNEQEPTEYYKLICKHCDGDGYIKFQHALPLESGNIDNPNSSIRTLFEILPCDVKDRVYIKQKCNVCGGQKYHLFDSSEWKLEIIHPKQEKA